jgi:hypothetical protein
MFLAAGYFIIANPGPSGHGNLSLGNDSDYRGFLLLKDIIFPKFDSPFIQK